MGISGVTFSVFGLQMDGCLTKGNGLEPKVANTYESKRCSESAPLKKSNEANKADVIMNGIKTLEEINKKDEM